MDRVSCPSVLECSSVSFAFRTLTITTKAQAALVCSQLGSQSVALDNAIRSRESTLKKEPEIGCSSMDGTQETKRAPGSRNQGAVSRRTVEHRVKYLGTPTYIAHPRCTAFYTFMAIRSRLQQEYTRNCSQCPYVNRTSMNYTQIMILWPLFQHSSQVLRRNACHTLP
jgi:hypothetical protein